MKRILLCVGCWLLLSTVTYAANGTLSITVDAAPVIGLSPPKIAVMRGFISTYQQVVNWGDTWNLTLPSGNDRILPLPVSDGSNYYAASTTFVIVPPNNTVNVLITYHLM